MAQASFAELEHDLKKRRTRRELFLEKMNGLVPWERLERRIEPFYPKAGRGRRPYPLRVMLRVHCVQLFYNLSDPGMEDLLYEVESVRRFVGLRLTAALPDETTILNFRHLLEKHGLGEGLFEEINAHLASRGHRLRTGTIVDASIIDAPSSTKNRRRARDPEMHQTKKGKQWYFGMKAHIGVDAGSGLIPNPLLTDAYGVWADGPVSMADGGDAPGGFAKPVPSLLAGRAERVGVVEEPVGEAVLFEELDDVLHRVEFRAVGREQDEGQVLGDREFLALVPAGTVENHHSVVARKHGGADPLEVLVHGDRVGPVGDMAHGLLRVLHT